MKKPPLVSIVLLCYNQARFFSEALSSVFAQTYPHWELIVVDDGSSDGSPAVIEQQLSAHPNIPFLKLTENVGNCKAFNQGLALCKGEYIIDLAADDLLMPNRLQQQVSAFANLPDDYGVTFSDAYLIDEAGRRMGTFYARDAAGNLIQPIPSGDLYQHLVGKQLISSPTMTIRKKVLEDLGGYDEALSYEDYDFWVRSSRKYRYHFQPMVLTAKRIVRHSHRGGFYQQRRNAHLRSTLLVSQKAARLNGNQAENEALATSLRYHLRLSVHTHNPEVGKGFWQLLQQMKSVHPIDRLYRLLLPISLAVAPLYTAFSAIRAKLVTQIR